MNPIMPAPSPASHGTATRRRFLTTLAASGAFFTVPGAFAEALMATPAQTEGPFYPDHLPLDTDNDLLVINNGLTPAHGEVTYLHGRILTARGEPLRNATVEIWQCDNNGAYLHSKDENRSKRDSHFQGFGRFVTGSTGEYLFRTIKPVPYPGRTPHIHFKIRRGATELLTTQCYIQDHPLNATDGVLRGIKDPKALRALATRFMPLEKSKAGELTARWDVVIGSTPEA